MKCGTDGFVANSNKLTPLKVKKATAVGRYADGNCLYLLIDKSGAKRWVLRLVVRGKRRDMGLGSAKLISLEEARHLATTYRRVAREGGDPFFGKGQFQKFLGYVSRGGIQSLQTQCSSMEE